MTVLSSKYPTLYSLHALICKKKPMYGKSITTFLSKNDIPYFEWAESMLRPYIDSLAVDINFISDSYILLCDSILSEQIYFKRYGKYRCGSYEELKETIYADPEFAFKYMIGVTVSYLFWPQHYQILQFFKEDFKQLCLGQSFLEIGAGHGWFLAEAMKSDKFKSLMGIDINKKSLATAKSFTKNIMPQAEIEFVDADVLKLDNKKLSFDCIAMIEALQCVSNPLEYLKKIHELLNSKGKAYIAVAINAPSLDSIYQFSSLNEFSNMIKNSGLCVRKDLVVSFENCFSRNSDGRSLLYAVIASKMQV